jgi:hypothetical protein
MVMEKICGILKHRYVSFTHSFQYKQLTLQNDKQYQVSKYEERSLYSKITFSV